MKTNNTIKFLAVLFAAGTMALSCDVLEKVPGSDFTEDTVFESQKDFESFLFGTYMIGLHSYYPYHNLNASGGVNMNPNPTMCMTSPMSDESEMAPSWHQSHIWNSAGLQKNNIVQQEDRRWNLRWMALRRANIIIERVDATDFTATEKRGYKGEALFIRALNHFEIFKRYGGMPIVDKRFGVSDEWKVPRSSVKDYVEFIVKDCDDAAECLDGITYLENQRGRITKAACLALKAKVLLYAASPLFNSAEPFLPTEHPELVCYGDYDVNRWKRAADAAKAALDEAAAEGFGILDTDDPDNDYRKVWEEYDNKEIILAEKFTAKQGNWTFPWCVLIPAGLNMSAWADNGVCVTHNFIAKYEKKDGSAMVWNKPDVEGDDIMEKYAQLEPRFHQTIAYNGSPWNNSFPDMQLYQKYVDSRDNTIKLVTNGESPQPKANVTGALMHKIIPRVLDNVGSNYQVTPNGILFRVAELYLNYAEALNELEGPTAAVYDALRPVRDRAGMRDFPAGLTKEQMRERIKNERAIELSFEDHRFSDIRRWMDAEEDGVMKGDFYKEELTHISGVGLNQKCTYVITKFETRSFNRNMYLHPILESEINKGYLTQNPGW